MKIMRRIVLLIVMAAFAVLAIKGIFNDADITTESGRYAWSSAVVLGVGVVYFVVDMILGDSGL